MSDIERNKKVDFFDLAEKKHSSLFKNNELKMGIWTIPIPKEKQSEVKKKLETYAKEILIKVDNEDFEYKFPKIEFEYSSNFLINKYNIIIFCKITVFGEDQRMMMGGALKSKNEVEENQTFI